MSHTRILFVDDDHATRLAAAELLEGEGYAVCLARDGLEALAAFTDLDPHLVVTDLEMPRMNGEVLFGRIREASPGTPVVIITAHRGIDAERKAQALGADGFVNKPIELDVFLGLVKRLL